MSFYRFVVFALKILTHVLFRVREKKDPSLASIDGPIIIAPNHTSYLDPILVAISWEKELHFFATEDIFKNPLFGFLLKKGNTHPIVRGQEVSSIKQASRLLEEGKSIVIFPEGTRSKDGKIALLRHGVAHISLKNRCPVIPCFLGGAFAIWPRHARFPKLFKKISISYGKPLFPPQDLNAENRKQYQDEFTKTLHQELHNLASS